MTGISKWNGINHFYKAKMLHFIAAVEGLLLPKAIRDVIYYSLTKFIHPPPSKQI